MFGVIYVIVNLLNGMKYVGQTRQKLGKRINRHKHGNLYIDKTIQKYGWENFSVEILEECESAEQLNEREKFWIATLNCMVPNGYNRTHGGGGASHSPSAQTLERLSAAQIKRFKDPVEHEKLSKAHMGYRHTEEAKLNMSLAQNKRFSDPAECKKISDATKGRNFSDQHCKNISFALKKYFNNPGSHKKMSEVALKRFEDPAEHEKLSKAHTGKKDTDKTRAKKSAAQKKRWAKRRETAKKIANEMFMFLIMLVLAIQNDTPTLATGMDGLMSIVIADAARKSAEENRPVKISELMPKL